MTDKSIGSLDGIIRGVRSVLAALLIFAAPAAAATRIPGSSHCAGPQRGSEVAPAFASGPGVTIAAWQSGPSPVDGRSAALEVAYTRDGGETWTRERVTGCRGRWGEPSLAIGPDGTAYLASSGVVRVSHDGGATWTAVRVGRASGVTADPTRPGTAYALWGGNGRVLMAQTADAGATWSEPRVIARGQVLDPGSIAVLPDGALLHGWFRAGPLRETLVASRSTDLGATWSDPVRVGGVVEPAFGVRSTPFAGPAVAPDGRAYAAWVSGARVLVARSDDGGATWHSPRVAASGFGPGLSVTPDGGVTVAAYRLLSGFRADVVAARSTDRGRTWRLRRESDPFSLRRSPRVFRTERRLGNATAAVFALGPPLARRGRADVFFAPLP